MDNKIGFLVVGTQKSGTSALDEYLRGHPEIGLANRKEVHFFDNEKAFASTIDYDNYHQYFDNRNRRIHGECTPIYMYWTPSMRRIYEYNQDMKIIAILRNPVERAFSHWNMERDRKAEIIDFSTAILNESERCREALPLQHRIYSYIDRGFYSEQIRRIWRFFPKEQTLFLKHEELRNYPHETLKKICHFLDVPPFQKIEPKTIHSRPYISQIENKDRSYLINLFKNDINQIEQILDWNCSDWKK